MKKIKSCLICDRPVAKSLSYQAEVAYIAKNFLTGEKSLNKLKGHICPVCNKKGGYKTDSRKLEKFKGGKSGRF